jgi:hypothetical protein
VGDINRKIRMSIGGILLEIDKIMECLEKRLNRDGIFSFILGILLSMMTRATSISWTEKRMA